jgi:hypothetical protein
MARWDDERLEQRFDRWVETGRQLVDGVAGARPGSRGAVRGPNRRPGPRLNPGELGRWVEGKLDWLLDEEGDDDWREPWQSQRSDDPQSMDRQSTGRRRPLDAISRRGRSVGRAVEPRPLTPERPQEPPLTGEWPDDEAFSVTRWQRQPGSAPDAQGRQDFDRDREPPTSGGRPLPRSSRSRFRR